VDAYDYDAVPTCQQLFWQQGQQLPFYPHHSCGKHHILATSSAQVVFDFYSPNWSETEDFSSITSQK